MAKGINKVILVGNVGQKPEMKAMPSGDQVASFSLATSESWKDKNTGQQQERTEWHNCVAFKGLAGVIGQYVNQGSKLYVEGQLRTQSWEKDGVKRYKTEIVVSDMQMLDSKGGDQQAPQQQAPQQQYQQAPQQQYQQQAQQQRQPQQGSYGQPDQYGNLEGAPF
tara:strand:+ start:476 stop:970 length:495 start_codon:yes stop_codon:yes gene_type:complete